MLIGYNSHERLRCEGPRVHLAHRATAHPFSRPGEVGRCVQGHTGARERACTRTQNLKAPIPAPVSPNLSLPGQRSGVEAPAQATCPLTSQGLSGDKETPLSGWGNAVVEVPLVPGSGVAHRLWASRGDCFPSVCSPGALGEYSGEALPGPRLSPPAQQC